MYMTCMTSTTQRPTAGPHTEPVLEVSSTAELSHPANQPFRALAGIVHALPSWERYEAASPQQRAAIERQWKDNWRSDEAQRLFQRAAARRSAGNRTTENPSADCATSSLISSEFIRKLSFKEQMALHAADRAQYQRYLDWLFALNAPATKHWGLREFLHRRDLDHEREITHGDDYQVTPEQFGWRTR